MKSWAVESWIQEIKTRPETFTFSDHYLTDSLSGQKLWIGNGLFFISFAMPKYNVSIIDKIRLWWVIRRLADWQICNLTSKARQKSGHNN